MDIEHERHTVCVALFCIQFDGSCSSRHSTAADAVVQP